MGLILGPLIKFPIKWVLLHTQRPLVCRHAIYHLSLSLSLVFTIRTCVYYLSSSVELIVSGLGFHSSLVQDYYNFLMRQGSPADQCLGWKVSGFSYSLKSLKIIWCEVLGHGRRQRRNYMNNLCSSRNQSKPARLASTDDFRRLSLFPQKFRTRTKEIEEINESL